MIKRFDMWLAVIAAGISGALPGWAEAPAGYYSACEGKKGAALLSALCDKIGPHTNVGYDGLWNVYKTSDVRPNGKVWDMYSTKQWTVGQQKCGNYKYVGDCINREHSMPKSWFSEGQPMKSDAFHVYPTDGKVNGQRSNYPYGECANGTTLPPNGSILALGKLGTSTFAGYSGTVFEPDDEYKGDFARTYFYMAACYNDRIAGWSSDMMAGNRYPVYTTWAVNLLLKWHRQDPVSSKEIERNEAVYAHQHNRNPFIDHPDMAEHIWGEYKDTGWSSSGVARPSIASPADGSAIDLGKCGTGIERTHTVTVKGQSLTTDINVSVSGAGFSAATTTLAASAANSDAGAALAISYRSASAGASAGTLVLTSGDARSSVTLRAEAVDGLPALPAINVSETSFQARWVSIDPTGTNYTLDVTCGGTSIPGYPKPVAASTERFTVNNLTPATEYAYTLSSPSGLRSNEVMVTTAAPVPSIQFLFDGDLYFTSEPGVPSEAAELLADIENISDPVVLSVSAPFELSTDKSAWSRSLTLAAEEDRFYLRMNGDAAGSYTTTLLATAGAYVNDDVTVEGVIAAEPTFIETFEAPSELKSYDGGYYQGAACAWNVVGALVGTDPRDVHSGAQGLRMHKTAGVDSRIEMAEPRMHGIGTVTFHAKAWNGEGGEVALEVSADAGLTWHEAKRFDIGDEAWQQYSATVNETGMVRMRLTRLSGRRIAIDDIEATDYAASAVAELEYHAWDAYCRDGQLVIENRSGLPLGITVCSPNGAVWYTGTISSTTVLDLPAGIYLVTSGGFTRKTVVK